jgi:hypothetical protein
VMGPLTLAAWARVLGYVRDRHEEEQRWQAGPLTQDQRRGVVLRWMRAQADLRLVKADLARREAEGREPFDEEFFAELWRFAEEAWERAGWCDSVISVVGLLRPQIVAALAAGLEQTILEGTP